MSDLLARMAAESHTRVAVDKRREPLNALTCRALEAPTPPDLLIGRTGFELIAEYKRRSPSGGLLTTSSRSTASISDQVAAYTLGGAAAISVLTEPEEFQGSLDDLTTASKATHVPVLRKDFLVDPYQVYQTRAAGGAGILLIIRILDLTMLHDMLTAAAVTGLFVLIEAFDRSDVGRATEAAKLSRSLGVTTLVGLNARNLVTLQTERSRLGELNDLLPNNYTRVAESSLTAPAHAAEVVELGYNVALVGTALMRAQHPAALTAAMIAAGRKANERLCISK